MDRIAGRDDAGRSTRRRQAEPGSGGDRPDRRQVLAAAGAVAVAALAVLVSAMRSAEGWVPTTDWALIEHTVRGVTDHLPLVGVPSSMGFYHPGPLPYLLLAVPYHLLGADPEALAISSGLLGATSVVGIGWTSWRRGGLPLVLGAMAATVWLAGSLPAGTLADPWNPWVAVLPGAWLLLLVWSVLDDDLAMVPWAVGVGSFVLQAHVGYLALLAVLAVPVVVVVARSLRRAASRRAALRATVAAGAVAVVAWCLPVLEQLTTSPGNVGRGWRYFTGPDADGRSGPGRVGGLLATELGWAPPWLTGDEPIEPFTRSVVPSSLWQLVVPVALVALGWWWTRGDRSTRAGVVTATAAVAGTALAFAGLGPGRAFAYVVRFSWAVAMVAAVAVAWAGSRRLFERRPGWVGPTSVGLALLLAAAAVRVVVVGGSATPPVHDPDTRGIELACLDQVWDDVAAVAGDAPVHLTSVEYWPVLVAPILNELERGGTDVAIAVRSGFFVHEEGRGPEPGEVVLAVVDEQGVGRWAPPDGAVEVARCDLLSEEERQTWEAVQGEVAPPVDESADDAFRRLDLTLRSDRWFVFRLPEGTQGHDVGP